MSEGQGTVYVVDDDSQMRKALVRLFTSNGLKAHAFSSAGEFLGQAPAERPACLLLDIRMPGLSGLDLQTELADRKIRLPIVFITGHGDVRASVRAMKGGAVDFLLKPFNDRDLISTVQQALATDRQLAYSIERQEEFRRRLQSLTPREREVHDRVIKGLLNKQIAAELGASEQTIKVHRHRIMSKMGVASVAELVEGAIKYGEAT
jgi:RNA polymerase sigma factor (sigma-70 family)